MPPEFSDIINSEDQLREIIGNPAERTMRKVITVLDDHCRTFIANSPFVLLASSDQHGNIDVSPKGDPAGFVKVLDDKTLVLPDRPGNRRADSLTNILQDDHIGLLFIIPGKRETLRVNGRAKIVRDTWVREQLAIEDKLPDLAIVVTVDEAFMHCAKCIIRSNLWMPESWPDISEIAPLAQVMIDHASLTCSVDEFQEIIDHSYTNLLY